MPCSLKDLTKNGDDIALYILSATYKAAQAKLARDGHSEAAADLNVIFEQWPDAAHYLGGIMSQVGKDDNTRDILLQQSNLRFTIGIPGDLEERYESLSERGKENWPEIKEKIDNYLAQEGWGEQRR